ncbi:hypothetical protein BKA64DRAFT_745622 [Cadophora sp. MPI-SDFR-AT-0126]|nr:hypothetical protein BKA64DRAFT_745622 [Leotiomycetes sp. MPI-SDFR-AT-0126]
MSPTTTAPPPLAGVSILYIPGNRIHSADDHQHSLPHISLDLNHERVIDTARLGNKTRFINHSGTAADLLNCEAKIVLVNGEHRIKFIALRDLEVGEELLFNYVGRPGIDKKGRGSKMRKTATPMGPVVEEDLYAAQAEEDAEEDDESVRLRRKRFRLQDIAGN